MVSKTAIVQPFTDPDIIRRCTNPIQEDFPSLQKVIRSTSVQPNGTLKCLLSSMVITPDNPTEIWVKDSNGFYIDADYAHIAGSISGGGLECGIYDVALIATGYAPSEGADGTNILCVFHKPQVGVAIRTRSTYIPVTTGVIASSGVSPANYIYTNYFDIAQIAPRYVAMGTCIRQASNTGESYLGDGTYAVKYTPTSIIGTINLGTIDFSFETNGYSALSTRFTGIYFFVFKNGAPSQDFMQRAIGWMGTRSDGALYPGFIGL